MKFKAFVIASALICGTAINAQSVKYDDRHVSSEALEGREWTIAQYYSHGEMQPPHERVLRTPQPYIRFVNDSIQGSSGCGQLKGDYKRSGDHLVLSPNWSDDPKTPCTTGQKEDASIILDALRNVRFIGTPPDYWHDDSVLLTNEEDKPQITLAPKQPGKDLADLHYSYWQLEELSKSRASLSEVIVYIAEDTITISTRACLYSYPFDYRMAVLKFSPAWRYGCDKAIAGQSDSIIVQQFEKSLHATASYEHQGATLTFFDKSHNQLFTLNTLRSKGIENRDWRVTKYRNLKTQQSSNCQMLTPTQFTEITFVNGRLDGTLGCGGLVGSYKLSGERMTLNASSFLAGRCDGESDEQDYKALQAFKRSTRIEEQDGHIMLFDSVGEIQMQLDPL